jgi:hypothetical protein
MQGAGPMSDPSSEHEIVCCACQEAPVSEDGLCRDCADWCKNFFTKLFPDEDAAS